MEATIQCYEAALYDSLTAKGYYKSAIIETSGIDGFMMRNDLGAWVILIMFRGALCEIARGEGFEALPVPPNL